MLCSERYPYNLVFSEDERHQVLSARRKVFLLTRADLRIPTPGLSYTYDALRAPGFTNQMFPALNSSTSNDRQ